MQVTVKVTNTSTLVSASATMLEFFADGSPKFVTITSGANEVTLTNGQSVTVAYTDAVYAIGNGGTLRVTYDAVYPPSADFSADNLYPIPSWVTIPDKAPSHSLYRSPQGRFYTDIDFDDQRPSTVITYFVDWENGSDTNDGLTKNTALKGIYTAIGKATGAKAIKVRPGMYALPVSGTALAWFGRNLITTCTIEPWDDEPDGIVYSSMHMEGLVWSSVSGSANVYQATCPNTPGIVTDATFLDSRGMPIPLDKISTTLTPGTFSVSGSVISVMLLDQRAPDADVRVYVSGSTQNCKFNIATDSTLWMRNIHFYGGLRNLDFADTRTNPATPNQLWAQDCIFAYTEKTQDSVQLKGDAFAFMERCESHYAGADAFDWHDYPTDSGGPAVQIIFQDCKAFNAGLKNTSNDLSNGYTGHYGVVGYNLNPVANNCKGRLYHNVVGCNVLTAGAWGESSVPTNTASFSAIYGCGADSVASTDTFIECDGTKATYLFDVTANAHAYTRACGSGRLPNRVNGTLTQF
jgi:hypothetical protein